MHDVVITLKTFLDSILGNYTPISVEDAQGTVVYLSGFAGVDWPYLIRACVFLLVMFCTYKILGGLICKTS